MSDVAKIEQTAVSALTEADLMNVLQNSLYPGAKTESIKLVLGYCKAAGLDPMLKPVHIVPMSVKTGRKKPNSDYDEYEMRDVVMPGIGLYRTQASRTGHYAGVSEPEFGPTKEMKIGDSKMEYPEWCKVTVNKIVDGHVSPFTATERWLENYATVKRDSTIPNAMWKRRPFAQLAKCAEAQALRKAFPELGAAPTADETIMPEDETQVIEYKTIEQPKAKSEAKTVEGEVIPETGEVIDQETGEIKPAPSDDRPLTTGELVNLKKKMEAKKITEEQFKLKWGVQLSELTKTDWKPVNDWIRSAP